MIDGQKPPTYNLVGVVYHSGTMNGGHYTSACFNSEAQQWYEYNDSSVQEIDDPNTLVNSSAYILVYQR
jgi:ubiquitin C-terminal hydrolase